MEPLIAYQKKTQQVGTVDITVSIRKDVYKQLAAAKHPFITHDEYKITTEHSRLTQNELGIAWAEHSETIKFKQQSVDLIEPLAKALQQLHDYFEPDVEAWYCFDAKETVEIPAIRYCYEHKEIQYETRIKIKISTELYEWLSQGEQHIRNFIFTTESSNKTVCFNKERQACLPYSKELLEVLLEFKQEFIKEKQLWISI